MDDREPCRDQPTTSSSGVRWADPRLRGDELMWVALVVAVVLVALTAAGIMGRIDGSLGPPTTTSSYVPLPGDRLTPADLESLRLDTAFRGYRMDQVDEVIGRLSEEIRTLALRLDGDVAASEGDDAGQVADGSTHEQPAPARVNDPDVDPA